MGDENNQLLLLATAVTLQSSIQACAQFVSQVNDRLIEVIPALHNWVCVCRSVRPYFDTIHSVQL